MAKYKSQATPATLAAKKKLTKWHIAYDVTEYGPVTGGLITAIILNPAVWKWLIFILLGTLMIGSIVYAFKKSGKTIVWGIILVMCIALRGAVIYTIVATCFVLSAANDLWIKPQYDKYKEKYNQFKNMDEYKQNSK